MELNKRQYLLKALAKSGAYSILVELLDERIVVKNDKRPSGDVLKDMPDYYMREGAIEELRWIKSLIKDFKKEYETKRESLDDDQANAPVSR